MSYQYYKELERPEDFKIYLEKENRDVNRNRKVYQNILPEFIKNNQDLFKKLKWLEEFISAHNEKFGYPLFMESNKRRTLSEIYYYKEYLAQEREECGLEEIQFIRNSYELIRKLNEYEVYCNYFMELYSEKNDIFLEIKEAIDVSYREIVRVIKIPSARKVMELSVPNGWYITKSGFLYNPNGKVGDSIRGHKEGNLRYAFERIESILNSNREVGKPYYKENETYKEHLEKIIKESCVTELDFQIYANSVYDFPLTLTEKMLKEKGFANYVRTLPDEELKTIILPNQNKCVPVKNKEQERLFKFAKTLSEMKVSYQPNINTLVRGYYAAVIDFYDAFKKLNVSSKKSEMYKHIWKLCRSDYNDVLIRFCGFSKVESCEKKITTASPFGIELFKEYLRLGWDLYIIPEIVYSEVLDDVRPESYIVTRYLEEKLESYEGKGRVLIRGINC